MINLDKAFIYVILKNKSSKNLNLRRIFMKKEKGFTLIELVIVLILLGILAAVAVPKFVDLQKDAKKSGVKGATASVRSALNVYYANKAIKGGGPLQFPQDETSLKAAVGGAIPVNPINNKSDVKIGTDAFGTTNSAYGWIYNKDTGQFWTAVKGDFYPNMF